MIPIFWYWDISVAHGREYAGGRYDGILCRYIKHDGGQIGIELFDLSASAVWEKIRETNTVTNSDYAAYLMGELIGAEAAVYTGLTFRPDEPNRLMRLYERIDTSESNETSGTDV